MKSVLFVLALAVSAQVHAATLTCEGIDQTGVPLTAVFEIGEKTIKTPSFYDAYGTHVPGEEVTVDSTTLVTIMANGEEVFRLEGDIDTSRSPEVVLAGGYVFKPALFSVYHTTAEHTPILVFNMLDTKAETNSASLSVNAADVVLEADLTCK